MKNSVRQGQGRRRFLKQAVTAVPGVIAISGVAYAASDGDNDVSSEEPQQLSQGYRESEHIKKYYKKAGF